MSTKEMKAFLIDLSVAIHEHYYDEDVELKDAYLFLESYIDDLNMLVEDL